MMPPSSGAGSLPPGRRVRRPNGVPRPTVPLLLACSLAGLWGCDVPTDPPEWEQRWVVPAEGTTVGVEEFLPEGVTVIPGGSVFEVDVDPVSFHETLGNLCPLCGPLNGTVAPKPSFENTFQHAVDFPEDVLQVEVQEGHVRVVAQNGFGFDPIRPGGGATGSITLALYSGGLGGTLMDEVTVHGETAAFPPGTTLTLDLEFSGPEVDPLLVAVEVDSPAGDPTAIDTGQFITVSASVITLRVSSAIVTTAGREFHLEEEELDMEDVDETVVDRIMSGAIELDIQNPWGVGAQTSFVIKGPFPDIEKSFTIGAGATSTARVEFTQDELRTFLGKTGVTFGGSGIVAAGAPPATVSPGQSLFLDFKLDLVVRIGGGEG